MQKLVLPVEDGVSMVRVVVRCALESRLAAGVAVVHNPEFPRVWESISDLPVVSVPNHESVNGMSTSVNKAVAFLQKVDAGAGVFVLGDQPHLGKDVIDRVIDTYRNTCGRIVQARYEDGYGHPVLFNSTLFTELSQVVGDQGGRPIIQRYKANRVDVHVGTPAPHDIDTMEDYKAYLQTDIHSQYL